MLPQDSVANASAVCADLFHSFPGLECVVMCGVAGGIPNLADPQRHVRLGDIVVAEEIVSFGHVRRIDGEEVLRRPTGGRSANLTLRGIGKSFLAVALFRSFPSPLCGL